jgi:hypothetical protein
MADRHTIIVRVDDGKVSEVLFCSCCPALTLEVRTYTKDKEAVTSARPFWSTPAGGESAPKFERDEHGVYRAMYHEPDGDVE